MSDTTIPTLSTFVRDRLAEHCDALGHDVESVDLPSGERMLYVDRFDCTARVYVDGFTLRDADDRHMRPISLRGFGWVAEPTDTRRVHGPIAMAPCTRCALPIPRVPWMPTKDAIHPSCLAAEAVARGTFDHPTTTR